MKVTKVPGLVLKTDKRRYNVGETVIVSIENKGHELITLGYLDRRIAIKNLMTGEYIYYIGTYPGQPIPLIAFILEPDDSLQSLRWDQKYYTVTYIPYLKGEPVEIPVDIELRPVYMERETITYMPYSKGTPIKETPLLEEKIKEPYRIPIDLIDLEIEWRPVYGEHNGEQVPEGVYIAEAPNLDLRTTFVIGHPGVARRRS